MVKKETQEEQPFVNPIDKDKVAENPGLLPYAHTAGGAIVKPEDKGKIKGRALAAMEGQTEMQMDQIKEQIQLLADQAHKLQRRKELSAQIYLADMGFEPLINHVYHVYRRKSGEMTLSMVAPQEWGRSMPFESYVATARLMADHTWEVLEDNEGLRE
ncbi:MAG: DUF2452 domain-containing protein [Bacteroidota bacterium]